jgi:DNA-binding beta-propeller fold protein YncE
LEISDELSALGSPRYVLPGQNGIAYVSDLYANELGVVDIVSGEFATTIPVPGWVEEMVYANGSLYGTCPSNDCLVRVDTATNSLLETIWVEAGPMSIVTDRNEMLWTLSRSVGSVPARLSVIDPTTNNVVRVLEFDGTVQPAQLKINGAGDELYYIYGSGVCRMSVEATEVVSEAFIQGYGQTPYGLAVQPETDEIYLTDAKDFIQPGKAYRFSNTGQLLDSISCGTIPQNIVF